MLRTRFQTPLILIVSFIKTGVKMVTSLTDEKTHEICSHLESIAEEIGLPLNLSPESIENIEHILLGLKQAGEVEALNGAEFMCGVYMGEILRKKLNAKWVYDEEHQEHAVNIDSNLIFPIAKIRKFVTEPDSEGLVFYAQVIMAKEKS